MLSKVAESNDHARSTRSEVGSMAKSRTTRKGPIFRPEILFKLYGKEKFILGMQKMLTVMEAEERRELMHQLTKSLTPNEWDELDRRLSERMNRRG
jgi:hypothetical protein